jgi:hypothetical protein
MKNFDINQDNLIYDNLNIYKEQEQEQINIEFIYDINYLNYKKKIFQKNISEDIILLNNLFDENICDVLINIYILKKKNKISVEQFKIFEIIFDFIINLNQINYIDHQNFFLLLIDFYKIFILSKQINIFFDQFIYKELVNYKLLINKINDLYYKLNEKILIFKIFIEFENINNINIIKQKIIYLANKLSFDLFMYYNSQEIYNIIINCFVYLNKITINNQNLLNIFLSNKDIFIKEYDKNIQNHLEIYSHDFELYIKFKINKNNIISKFSDNIIFIDKL